jgi:transposase-like protein
MDLEKCPYCKSNRVAPIFGKPKGARIWRFSCLDCHGLWTIRDGKKLIPIWRDKSEGVLGVYGTEELK